MSESRKLFLAARRGDLAKVAEAIEEHGISVNVTDAVRSYIYTSQEDLSLYSKTASLQEYRHGIRMLSVPCCGVQASWTPLMCAAANGKVAVVKYILSRKPRLNAMNQVSEWVGGWTCRWALIDCNGCAA